MKEILKYLDFIAPLIALIFILLNKMVLKQKAIKYLFYFLIVQLFFNGIAISITLIHKYFLHNSGNNLIFFHLNCLFSFYILLNYFKEINIIKRKVWLLLIFLISYISYLVIEDGFFLFNSVGFSLASLVIIILCFKYYYFLLKNPQVDNFFYSHDFWITTGLLTYYVCNFIIFLTFSYLAKSTPHTGNLWLFHNVVFAILCIYLIKGVSCKKKELISF